MPEQWIWSSPTTHTHDGLLPAGVAPGDFVRFDGSDWYIASEPIELTELVLTPSLAPAEDIEGGMYYNSTDKSVYICTGV